MSKSHICKKCLLIKPFEDFHKRKRMKLGISNECKECQVKRNREWRQKNPQAVVRHNKISHHTGYLKHKEEWDKKNRIWQKNNASFVRELAKNIARKQRATLSDSYIKQIISGSTGVERDAIPSEFIEVRRLLIKIKRFTRDKNENT